MVAKYLKIKKRTKHIKRDT